MKYIVTLKKLDDISKKVYLLELRYKKKYDKYKYNCKGR